MKKDTKFYTGFSKKELESLPVNYRLLTHFEFNSKIITSNTDTEGIGIDIDVYNGKVLSSEKPASPISKIINFE